MIFIAELAVYTGAGIWIGILLAPWRPWSTREQLSPCGSDAYCDSDVSVLIPARDEAATILRTLAAVRKQGENVWIVVVDDQSTDETLQIIRNIRDPRLTVIEGGTMPEGWTGKLWALEQGFQTIDTRYVMLLDADIEIQPGMLNAMRSLMDRKDVAFLSLLAELRMEHFWEKALLPAFVYFFKLLYPFRLSNSTNKRVAAAAGGCILVASKVISDIGGFRSLRGAIIDDCALARMVKNRGFRTWIGMTRGTKSHREYNGFKDVRNMVARTAFTQLGYSWLLLLLSTLLLLSATWFLPLALWLGNTQVMIVALIGFMAMIASYLPVLLYYKISPVWAPSLPITVMLYLYMTLVSAMRYLQGTRSEWKGRTYSS